uniref:beta-N-acetylhexosaminidase n=1 Tax=Sogatella furcifera TaxID=113103 RepID=A0AAU8KYZ5_SOGFU
MENRYGNNVLIHLDLKGCPLKIDYLENLFPKIREWGATGLLVEWEDTFPYSGRLVNIGSANTPSKAYSVEEVGRIADLARKNELDLVPLVQTFGHLEFVLKHPEWRHLREVSKYPSSMCPSHPEALELVTTMLDQILTMIPDTKYIHIGADEVWHMKFCEKCNPIMKERLFLTHVMKVLKYVATHHANVRPIMWDDMLRPVDLETLKEFEIGSIVEPMVWHYQPMESFSITEDVWDKYERVFDTVWVASAFKGATGSCQVLPIIKVHTSNHLGWLNTLEKHGNRFKRIQGIAMTGWSRYDHFATLCELLPASIPSLAICLCTWNRRTYNDDLHREVATSLGYPEGFLSSVPYPRPQPIAAELNFPGWRVAVGVEWLENIRLKHRNILNCDQINTWLNSWQIKNNFINPMQIESLLRPLSELTIEWEALKQYLQTHLNEVYYTYTIDEWTGTLVEPLHQQLVTLLDNAKEQVDKNS